MRLRGTAATLVLLIAPVARPLAAQSATTWLASAGVSFPAGVLNAYADHGWDVTAGVEHRLGSHPVALRLDLSLSRNTDVTGIGFHEATRFLVAMANVVYHVPGSRPHVYGFFGVGYMSRGFSSDDPDDPAIDDGFVAFQAGEGLIFRVRSATVFLETRIVSATGQQPLQFIPLVLGLRFGAGPK